MGNPVLQFQILSREPDKTAIFYAELFGWKIDANNPLGYRRIDTGSDQGIQGGIWPAPSQAQSFAQLFVGVKDVQESVGSAEKLGARVLIPPTVLPEGDENGGIAGSTRSVVRFVEKTMNRCELNGDGARTPRTMRARVHGRRTHVFVYALLLMMSSTQAVRAVEAPAIAVGKIVGQIQRADYQGDRPRLKNLHDDLTPFRENQEIATRVLYWSGLALWRRALNGFNDSADPPELQDDLTRAVDEFEQALEGAHNRRNRQNRNTRRNLLPNFYQNMASGFG